MDIVGKIHDYCELEEEKYYELANKSREENRTIDNMIATAQASAFQRVRYMIQELCENEEV